ncbi:hypothetical protein FDECE_2145 [Fusarium decemcellulare]|nr:hypothetical protein FDECE_2145 [Fusarium decemcellulare]
MESPSSIPGETPVLESETTHGEREATPPPASDLNSAQPLEHNQDAISVKTTTDDLFSQGSQEDTPSKEHSLGLEIKYPWGWSGSAYDDYDVITVHGIRDDYKTAWTDEKGNWLVKEQLFKNMSIREVDYSYEIGEKSMLYEPNGISLHAKELIDSYLGIRRVLEETETDRPIIWALSMAMQAPAKYGKISMLTTALIFVGTPHRFQSTDDLEDQLHKLVLLPGPPIINGTMAKVKRLATQVTETNQRFLATKLLDRAMVFNIFSQNVRDSLREKPIDHNSMAADGIDYSKDDFFNVVTPFPRYAHFIGHSFEAFGRIRWDNKNHLDLVNGPGSICFSAASRRFGVTGCPIKVGYRLIRLQVRLLSLAPPTRGLSIPFDPVLPHPPVLRWIHQQDPYVAFQRSGSGHKLLHIHGNGNPLINISEVSRLFYAALDSNTAAETSRSPEKTVVYFEFDQHDSRYATLPSMLKYLINVISWHFWDIGETFLTEELTFLDNTHAWTLEDLYHLYSRIRFCPINTQNLTLFISCFDQCPEDQRRWFLDRVLEEQSQKEATYRIILSTSSSNGLGVEGFPSESRVNLDDSPVYNDLRDNLTRDLQLGLIRLMSKRPIYKVCRSQIENLLQECNDAPQLGRIILTWLENCHRGQSIVDLMARVNSLFPVTANNIVHVFISSLEPRIQAKAQNAFNWIKHALEPWSPDSLIEALAVHEFRHTEPLLDDLDKESEVAEIEMALGEIVSIQNHDIRFSHPSFYHVPEFGIEGSAAERAARVNSSMAETCLRYFQLPGAQETLTKFYSARLGGGLLETPLDALVVSHPRTTMAEYSVRFWPHHYKASGEFKPSQLVHELFTNKESRAAWEVSFWLLSNPFTRINRHYISTLPVFAMLGLGDLVDENIGSANGQPCFDKDYWFAITEAARSGNERIVERLLDQVSVDEEELQTALIWAAAQDNARVLDVLMTKASELETFHWPEELVYRATATGQQDLLAAMLRSGCDINKPGTYFGATPGGVAAWRCQVSTIELLLSSESKLDLGSGDKDRDSLVTVVARTGNSHLMKLLLQGGASVKTRDPSGHSLVQVALQACAHKMVDILIEGGADFESGEKDSEVSYYLRPPLVVAADDGLIECVRVLLHHKADPNVKCVTGTALYKAVTENHVEIVRLLLEHNPKPNMDVTPPDQDALLIRAIHGGNTELVSLLIDHGARVDFVDPNAGYCKTPLSTACAEGNLDMVKLLLENKAKINYTGDELDPESDPPFFTSLYSGEVEVARYLLQHEEVDVTWEGPEGMGTLHGGFDLPEILPDLLKTGIPIDSQSIWGTVLHMAASSSCLESIKILVGNDPKPDLEAVVGEDGAKAEEIGCTPLQLACQNLEPKCVKALLEAGANPEFKNKNGDDAVDILLRAEADSKDVEEVLRLLISPPHSVPVDYVNEQGRSRLHGIHEKTSVAVARLLVEYKSPIDTRDLKGYTPLAVAVSKRNQDVAKYLIEQGANVNSFGPSYGSILHIATSNGSLDLVKLLLGSGADFDMVDLEYGESLLYTALGIKDTSQLYKMVQYLVDEAKVPVDKLGGQFRYPIIRAAHMTTASPITGTKLLKFLIRRKARLNVADNQGRRAIHFTCRSTSIDGIRALVEAGEDINAKDKFGRMPIHFAASNPDEDCMTYLLDMLKEANIDVADQDNWTPLLWAARSGSINTITRLLSRNADIWVRSASSDARARWSALKLANFAGRPPWLGEELTPEDSARVNLDGEKEDWDEFFHKTKAGDKKDDYCDSCLVNIIGVQWKCIECDDNFSLCFKCFSHRSEMHNPEHNFEDIGPLYDEELQSVDGSTGGDDVGHESPLEGATEEDGQGSLEDGIEIDLDNFNLDAED